MGGDMWQCDDQGKNAFDFAVESCEYTCLKILQQHKKRMVNCKLKTPSTCPYNDESTKIEDKCLLDSYRTEKVGADLSFCNATKRSDVQQKLLLEETLLDCSTNTIMNEAFCDSKHSDASVAECKSQSSGDFNISCKRYSIVTISSNENSVETLHSDDENGVSLLEKSFLSWFQCSQASTDETNSSSYHTPAEDFSDVNSKLLNESLAILNNSEIRKQLLLVGDSPGPVTNTTRQVYLERLKHLKNGTVILQTPNSPLCGYSSELSVIMRQHFCLKEMLSLEQKMSTDFDTPDKKIKWREGTQKVFFNYLLLDPSVTQNLPARWHNLPFTEQFDVFVNAIFYVGKGKGNRPYSHLYEAVKVSGKKTNKEADQKIKTVLRIWSTGKGVISLHCFQNTIACEAYTREACMIEALGLENLTNAKKGEYYGPVQSWTSKQKRRLGAFLLFRALHMFLYEGERQIRPADIRS